MNILIIDDDDYKIEKLKEYIPENINIDIAKCYNTGMKMLIKNEYDGLFLDMNFPVFEDEKIESRKGLFVLNQMKRKNINIPIAIFSSDTVEVSHYENVVKYIVNDGTYVGEDVLDFITLI